MYTLEINNRKHETMYPLLTLDDAAQCALRLHEATGKGIRIILNDREVGYVG